MHRLFVISCLLATLSPFLRVEARTLPHASLPDWPPEFEGVPLVPLPLTARESAFLDDFPGRVGRFRCGARELVLRWVARPTRRLHAASDCFRGAGYSIVPLPLLEEANGRAWSRFEARRKNESLLVSESITDPAGQSWTDPSAWYWAASTGSTSGPWLATTVARRN